MARFRTAPHNSEKTAPTLAISIPATAFDRHIIIGGPKDGGFLSPIDWALRTRRKVNKSGRTAIIFTAKETQEDGAILNEMLIDGSIVPQVADRYPLDRVVDAFELIESGHAPAKLIVVP